MDLKSIAEILKGSIDPNLRQEAEKKLSEVHKIIGFGPTLLQVVMSNDVELPTRQAGGIYLKNMVSLNSNTIILTFYVKHFLTETIFRFLPLGRKENLRLRESQSPSLFTSRIEPSSGTTSWTLWSTPLTSSGSSWRFA
jgi:hypothetical protein